MPTNSSSSRTVTLHDVARDAGVSIKTVSRVVNREPHVSDKTVTRVEASIQKLGYVPNIAARRLASRQSFVLGAIFDNASWNWLNDFQRGAIDAGRAAGYEILIHPCDIESHHAQDHVRRLVEQGSVDGLVLTPPCGDCMPIVDWLKERDVPFVRIAPRVRTGSWPTVSTSDRKGAHDMTTYLLSLGHRRLAFVKGDARQRSSDDRKVGFMTALTDHDAEIGAPVIEEGDFSYDSGVAAGRRLLATRPRPTAVFAANDDMAAGVLATVLAAGLRVPTDIAIVGFDDVDLARQVWPALTTIRQPTAAMAGKATQLLVEAIAARKTDSVPETGAADRHLVLSTTLVIRDSTEVLSDPEEPHSRRGDSPV